MQAGSSPPRPSRRQIWAFIAGVVVAALAGGAIVFKRGDAAPVTPPDELDRAQIPCDPESKHPVPAYTRSLGCRLTRAIERNGMTCRKDSKVEIYESGALRRCWLSSEITLEGLRCKDDVTLTTSGKLRRCQLANETEIDGVRVPANAWVTKYESNGKTKRIESYEIPVRVGALTCVGPLTFLHEQGGLARCTLAEETTIDGEKLAIGEAVCLDPAGKRVKDCAGMSFEMSELRHHNGIGIELLRSAMLPSSELKSAGSSE